MPQQISIQFHNELDDFLSEEHKSRRFRFELKGSRSIKDLIESIGIPHTEIATILVNDRPVDFSYLVQADDFIDVYPAGTQFQKTASGPGIDNTITCQPPALTETRFVLDVHLGRLAAYLRMLGLDCIYRNDYDDPALAEISANQQRILLTCDRRLLMRKQIIYGYFVRNRLPGKQLPEILTRFGLYQKLKPFTRCIHCNGKTISVSKKSIEDRLLAKTRKYYNEFYQCTSCNKIYWKGSHYEKMKKMIDTVSLSAITD